MDKKKVAPICFVILDGFGEAPASSYNAITSANTPFFDFVRKNYPFTILAASGTAVGLPEGYVGNSEVGHMTIGAGKIIKQPLTIIQEAIANKTFFEHPLFDKIANKVNHSKKKVHLLGLLSDVGVHAHIDHFFAVLQALSMRNISNVHIHPLLDGRDTSPCTASVYLQKLQDYIDTNQCGKIATLQGRFYAMDRDNNWQRTQESYNILTLQNKQKSYPSWQEVIDHCEKQKLSEEFLQPVQLCDDAVLQQGDIVIVLNYREDRIQQLVLALTAKDFNHFARSRFVHTDVITLIDFNDIPIPSFYTPATVTNTLKEELSKQKKTMFVIAETEKFAHITYFLACGHKEPFVHETQYLVPSLKLKKYDASPEMKAREITKKIIDFDQKDGANLYIANYANPDMVGHSGNLKATIQAIEVIDQEMQKLYDYFVKKKDGVLIITSDHGKAEEMFNPKTKRVITGHTKNPVPLFFITNNFNFKNISIDNCKELKDIKLLILDLIKITQ